MNIIQKVASLTLCFVVLTKVFDVETSQVNKLHKDASRRMNLDDHDQGRPVMHTFYEKASEGEDGLLDVWASEWNRAGFDTKILTLADAKANPYFEEMEKTVKPIFGERYNGLCFYRWLAMAQEGGGWMSDCDVLPTNFLIKEGLVLPNGGKFTSFQRHVPCLLSGSQGEWMRVTNLLVDAIPRTREKFGLPTDMRAFMVLANEGNHNIDFGNPYNDMRTGFQYKEPRKVDCDMMKIGRAIHFSHKDTDVAFQHGLFPVDIPKGTRTNPSRDKRAEGSSTFMDDWRNQCQNEIQDMKEQDPHK